MMVRPGAIELRSMSKRYPGWAEPTLVFVKSCGRGFVRERSTGKLRQPLCASLLGFHVNAFALLTSHGAVYIIVY